MKICALNLPEDKELILKTLLKKIKKDYQNDISVLVCYGSYITGETHAKSDLDFFFIPKTKKGFEMNKQFIIDGIGYDLWPLTWKRAQKIANFKENIASIIAKGVLIYYHKIKDKERFKTLQQKIENVDSNPEMKKKLINKATQFLDEAKAIFFDLKYSQKKAQDKKIYYYKILKLLTNSIAYINLTYLKKGVYNIEDEVKDYQKLPKNFIENFTKVIKSSNLSTKIDLLKRLIEDVDKLLSRQIKKKNANFNDKNLKGFYEEIKSNYNKLKQACDSEGFIKLYFIAHLIELEVKNLLNDKYWNFEFPKLIDEINKKSFKQFKNLVKKHEKELKKSLKKYDVDIVEYPNLDLFIKSFL
ncbi:MAG: nucleotidyltransferase domain-containing protein [Halanaerobiales bacterium]|nr:nucleotidyltransferase domain-containing protein [Halanaerobiales bacterium]